MIGRDSVITVRSESRRSGVLGRLQQLPWFFVFSVIVLACVGFTALYSAASGNWERWAEPQLIRFIVGFFGMMVIAVLDMKWIYRLAYPFWFFCIGLLFLVEVMGVIGMGAQRWLDLGFFNLQPSDLTKIAIVLAMARFYHDRTIDQIRGLRALVLPAIITAVPVVIIVLQPDLGTALMIVMIAAAMMFIGGAPWWLFAGGIASVAAITPIAYHFLHDYQKKRVLTFLNPESDPLGAGYHITQSKIAIGSGGIDGKGYLEGSQANLNFLPEKHTDFIFTLLAEEWGFIGCMALLALFSLVFLQGYRIAFRSRSDFGRLLALGLITNYSIYIIINIGMVTGLLPVVGEPLPLISYGGTVMMSTLFAFGMLLNVAVNRNQMMPRG